MTGCLDPIMNIARLISRLLQPIYDQAAKSMTFFKGAHAVHVVESYAQTGHLRHNTLFATLHIDDLCTIFPHDQTIQALERFLNIYLPDRQIQGITIEIMIQ